MARRKQAALEDVPQSLGAAISLMDDYVVYERAALEARIEAEREIDAIKVRRDRSIEILTQNQADRFARLKAWWEAGGSEIAGKKRSAELAGAAIGIRLTPQAVKFARGWNAKKALAWLQGLRWGDSQRFIRNKPELDKQAIIKAFGEEPVAGTFAPVLSVVQTDEFFIDCGLDETAIRARLGASPASNQE